MTGYAQTNNHSGYWIKAKSVIMGYKKYTEHVEALAKSYLMDIRYLDTQT